MKTKPTTLIIFFAILGVILGYPSIATRMAHRSSYKVLSQATTDAELLEATKGLGAFFRLSDDSWVAIRYSDSHAACWSSAVARDSDDRYYCSGEHYCGRFAGYRARVAEELRAEEEGEGIWGDVSQDMPNIHALATAKDLTEARKALRELGFEAYD